MYGPTSNEHLQKLTHTQEKKTPTNAYLDVSDTVAEIRDDEGRGLPVLPLVGARRDVGRGQVVVVGLRELVGDASTGKVGAELGEPALDLVLEEPGHVVERRQDEDGHGEEARPQVMLQPVEGEAQGHVPGKGKILLKSVLDSILPSFLPSAGREGSLEQKYF